MTTRPSKRRNDVVRRFPGLLACLAGPVGIAAAQDLPPPESPAAVESTRIEHFAVDGSAVATSLGDRSVSFNSTFAPFGDINDSGLRIRGTGSASWYRFVTSETPGVLGSGSTLEGGVLAGYQWSLQRLNFMALLGPTVSYGKDDGVTSTHVGVKTVVSSYARPTDQTMAYGSLTYSTIANFLQLQAKAGMKLIGDVYVGPEVNFSWRNVVPSFHNVAQLRLGGHISAVTLGPVQVGVAAGWARQPGLGSGYYGSANFYVTF